MRFLRIALVACCLAAAASAQEDFDGLADGIQQPIGPTSRPRTPTAPRPTATPTRGACSCDADGSGAVTISELIAGVNAALHGCR